MAVVGGIVAFALAVATGAYFMFTPTSGSTLTVSTNPRGATVEINGDSIGTTPLSDHALEPGAYNVEVRKEGYADLDTSLVLGSGQSLSVSGVQLRARPVRFQVTSEPTGAQVMIGATRIGATPIVNAEVQPGRTDVRIEKDGYAALDTTIQFDPGGEVLLTDVRLNEKQPQTTSTPSTTPEPRTTSPPAPTVSLSVEAPREARVEVSGTTQQGSGTIALREGVHTIRCTHPEYGEIETTVSVSQNDTDPVSCVFQREITVDAVGSWGNVWINGENTSTPTPHTVTLPPGRHEISVRLTRNTNLQVRGGVFKRELVSGQGDPTQAEFEGGKYQIDIVPGFQTYDHRLVFRIDS
jgi:hypothetical protein